VRDLRILRLAREPAAAMDATGSRRVAAESGAPSLDKGFLVTKALGAAAALNPVVEARSPGPIYLPLYSHVSTFTAAPTVLFQAAPRYPPSSKADTTPGPGAYALEDSLSRRAAGVRGREKFGSATMTSAVDVPGPGEYPRAETDQTRKRNPPKYSLKGRRVARPPAFEVPAPNAHQHAEPFNKKQFVARLTNPPIVRLGPPPRHGAASDSAARAGAGAGSDGAGGMRADSAAPGGRADLAQGGAASAGAPAVAPEKRGLHSAAAAMAHATPGPSEYAVDPGFKHLSTLARVPAYSMVPRRAPAKAGGMHITPEFHDAAPATGKQALSGKRTAPAPSLGGRTRFGSPYFL